MNEADKLIIKQLLDYCHAVEQRIADYGIDENKFINDSALFDMLLMPVFQIGELSGALSAEYTESHEIFPGLRLEDFAISSRMIMVL